MHIHTLHCVNEEFIGSTIYCGLFVTFEHCHLAIVSNLLHHSLFCYYPLKTNPQKTIFNWFWCVSSHYHAAMYGFCFLQRSPFSTPASSMLKILSMTAGDFSFDTVFRLSPSGESEDHDEILFPVISYFLWIILLIIMPLLFINMLVRSIHIMGILTSIKMTNGGPYVLNCSLHQSQCGFCMYSWHT